MFCRFCRRLCRRYDREPWTDALLLPLMMKMEREIFGDLFSFFGRAIVVVDVGGVLLGQKSRAAMIKTDSIDLEVFTLSHSPRCCCVLSYFDEII